MRPKNNVYTALILFALIFFVAIVKWGNPTDLFIYLKHLYLSVLSFFLIVYIFLDKGYSREFVIGKIFIFFAAFLLFAAVSLLWSVNKFFTIRDLLFFFNLFIIYFTVTNIAEKEDIPSALKLMILFALIVAGYDIILTANELFVERLKHVSTLGNPGYIGEYLLISSGTLLGLIASCAGGPAAGILYAAIFLFLFFSILLTQTRASILSVMVMTAVLVYKVIQSKKWTGMKFIAITIFLAVVIAATIPGRTYLLRFAHGINAENKTMIPPGTKPITYSTLKGRVLLYMQTLAMIKDHPVLGVGLGNYSIYYPRYKESIRNKAEEHTKLYSAHNEILNFTAECGVAGLFLILALYLYMIFPLLSTALNNKAADNITLPLLGIFTATAVSSLFGFNISRPEYGATFAACLGMLDIVNSPRKIKLSGPLFAAIFLILLAISGASSLLHMNMVKCEKEMQRGVRYYSAGDRVNALKFFARAYRYNKYDEKLIFYYGTTYYLLGDYKNAEEFLGRGLKLYPYEQRYNVNYATTLFAQGRYQEAEKILSNCLNNVPTAYMAANQLAIIYKHVYRDDAKAQEFVRKSMEIDPFQGPIDLSMPSL